jgi:hypothetical protein
MSTLKELPKSWAEFDRKGDAILKELQKTLLPEHANAMIAIDVESGDYCLGETSREAWTALRERHPDRVAYVSRVDGRPAFTYHRRVRS